MRDSASDTWSSAPPPPTMAASAFCSFLGKGRVEVVEAVSALSKLFAASGSTSESREAFFTNGAETDGPIDFRTGRKRRKHVLGYVRL